MMQDRDERGQSPAENPEGPTQEAQTAAHGSGPEEPKPDDLSPTPEAGEVDPEENRRPTPVRVVMEGGDEENSERIDQSRVIQEEEGGPEWVVTVSGRSVGGVLPLRTVPLMELNFAHAGSPDRPLRRALRHGITLAGITDQELLDSLRESEPFREPKQNQEDSKRKGQRGKNRRSQKS